MRETILRALKHIEQHEDVKIIYAVESGSRAWGFQSPDSDWDVRYLYVRRPIWYMSVNTGRDVIDQYNKQPYIKDHPEFDNKLLDITGWDIKKAFQLAAKSNPQLLEWLHSPIIYNADEQEFMQQAVEPVYRLYPAQEHYRSMAKSNFREFLQGDVVRYKKYLYVLRPLLAAQWVRMQGTFPPVPFQALLGILPTFVGGQWDGDFRVRGYTKEDVAELTRAISNLLAVKTISSEVDDAPRNPVLHAFIKREILRTDGIKDFVPTINVTDHLNRMFRRLVNKYWNE